MAVVGERAAEGDVVRVATRRVLHEEVRLGDRPRLRVHFLAEEVDVRLRIDWGPQWLTVPAQPFRDVLLGDHQHATRAAAGVVDGAHRATAGDARLVAREHEIHHQVDHVARGEVLAGIFVQRLVELADQLFEDCPHRGVVDLARVQIHGPEALQHLEQQPRLVELADGVVEVEPLQHLAHVAAEAGDVVAQVGCDVRRIGQQGFEVVARGVVEGESGSPAKLRVQVIQPASAQLGLPAQHLALGWCKHAIEPPEHGQRQDDVLVLAALEAVTDQIRDTPEEADDFAVVQRQASKRMPSAGTTGPRAV